MFIKLAAFEMILSLALTTSMILTLLLATAAIARSGLRGRFRLLALGIAAGLAIGPIEYVVNPQGLVILQYFDSILVQLTIVGVFRAVLYGLAVSVAVTLVMSWMARFRRRGDIWNVAIGIGLGMGLSTTALALLDSQSGWPPFVLVTAIANLPFQLCFALIVASAIIRLRFVGPKRGLSPATTYVIALILGTSYQTIVEATLTIGHWLAWMEPTWLGLVWLALIAIFWFTGLAVMISHRPVAIPEAHHPAKTAKKRPVLLRSGLWKIIALLVIAPAFALFFATWYLNFDTPLGRVMIYALLAAPLLAGSVIFRTALALEAEPAKFRLR